MLHLGGNFVLAKSETKCRWTIPSVPQGEIPGKRGGSDGKLVLRARARQGTADAHHSQSIQASSCCLSAVLKFGDPSGSVSSSEPNLNVVF